MVNKSGTLILILSSFLNLAAYSQKTAVDSFINSQMKRLHIPGFEAIAIKDDKIIWTGYYGYQNLEKKIPVTAQTIFEAASTSKTITAAAIMQLYAAGKFRLDDDINRYLDFKIVNPRYPAIPITIGQLLRRRSSIDDNVDYLSQFGETNHGDPDISLKDFIKGYLKLTGSIMIKSRISMTTHRVRRPNIQTLALLY